MPAEARTAKEPFNYSHEALTFLGDQIKFIAEDTLELAIERLTALVQVGLISIKEPTEPVLLYQGKDFGEIRFWDVVDRVFITGDLSPDILFSLDFLNGWRERFAMFDLHKPGSLLALEMRSTLGMNQFLDFPKRINGTEAFWDEFGVGGYGDAEGNGFFRWRERVFAFNQEYMNGLKNDPRFMNREERLELMAVGENTFEEYCHSGVIDAIQKTISEVDAHNYYFYNNANSVVLTMKDGIFKVENAYSPDAQTKKFRAEKLGVKEKDLYTISEKTSGGVFGVSTGRGSCFEKIFCFMASKGKNIKSERRNDLKKMLMRLLDDVKCQEALMRRQKEALSNLKKDMIIQYQADVKDIKARIRKKQKRAYDSFQELCVTFQANEADGKIKSRSIIGADKVHEFGGKVVAGTLNGSTFFKNAQTGDWYYMMPKSSEIKYSKTASRMLNTIGAGSTDEKKRIQVIKRIFRKSTKLFDEEINNMLHPIEGMRENIRKPIFDFEKWIEAGFRIEINSNSHDLEGHIYLPLPNGFRFMGDYFVPIDCELKWKINLRQRNISAMFGRSMSVGRFHPHITCSTGAVGVWGSVCQGGFAKDDVWNEAMFMDESPQDFILHALRFMNNYYHESASDIHRHMEWKTALKQLPDGTAKLVKLTDLPLQSYGKENASHLTNEVPMFCAPKAVPEPAKVKVEEAKEKVAS